MKYHRVTTTIGRYAYDSCSGVAVLNNWTNIVLADIGDVEAGDVIMMFGAVYGQKGGVAGSLEYNPVKAGTATVFMPGQAPMPPVLYYATIGANTLIGRPWNSVARVTAAGSLQLGIQGRSLGSNFAVGADQARIDLILLTTEVG